jgi:cytochrome P450
MSETIIFTASRTLQGKEVRDLMDSTFADYYHDLDMGFSPINFMLPWFPLPHNRRRDAAHKKMVQVYGDIARKRRSGDVERDEEDMIWNLMNCTYKDGTKIPDHEIAGIMIALLMGGQHSSASTTAWALLHLAERADLQEELIAEQKSVLGKDLPPLKYEDLSKLTMHAQVIKETLRMHSPIHSILRRVKQPIPVEGTSYIIPTSHQLLAAPIASSMSTEFFPNPEKWQPHRWDAGVVTLEEEEKIDYGYGLISKGANSPYLPFGAGRHRCIGEQFAYLQMQTIIATLVREFKFSLDPKKAFPATDYAVSLETVPNCAVHSDNI